MHEVFLQRIAAHAAMREDYNFRVFLEYGDEVRTVIGQGTITVLSCTLSDYWHCCVWLVALLCLVGGIFVSGRWCCCVWLVALLCLVGGIVVSGWWYCCVWLVVLLCLVGGIVVSGWWHCCV